MDITTDSLETPRPLIDAIEQKLGFKFDLDAASTEQNKICALRLNDGLTDVWSGHVWCNPPYSRGNINKWVKRALNHANARWWNTTITLLLPANTSADWFKRCVDHKSVSFLFINKRVKFLMDGKPTRFPASFSSVAITLYSKTYMIDGPKIDCLEWK
jgi:phage N-6-adenine-methyltransferase